MRAGLLAASVLVLVACSERAPDVPEVASKSEPTSIEPVAPAEVTDANVLMLEQIRARLVGDFRSLDDPKSTLSITADGKWTDSYDGEGSAPADWKLFAGDHPPPGADGTFTPASRYLEVKHADGTFYYELGGVSANGFDMFYTARGNRLSYERVS